MTLYGYIAEFTSASSVYEAAKKVRDAGYTRWDVHSPFPIHGMDDAMGVKRSRLPYIVLVGGALGLLTAFVLQYYTQVSLYPTIVQAKPANIFTIPAFFPVMFELTVLCSAFATIFGVFVLMGLPRWYHPLFNSERFTRFSDDGFFISIEASDPNFSREETRQFLAGLSEYVEEVEEDFS